MASTHRRGVVGTATMLCVLLGVSSRSLAQTAPSPVFSPSELNALNRRNADAVDTCVRVDVMITRMKTLPGEEKRLRSRLTSGIMTHMDKSIISATEKGVTEAALDLIRKDNAQRLASINGQILITRANKSSSNRFTSRIDFAASRARYDVVDMRDLDALCKKAGLGDLQRMSLDQTKSIVATESSSTHRFKRGNRDLVVDGGQPRFTYEVRRRFGIIPPWVFDGRFLLERRRSNTKAQPDGIDIVGRDASTKKLAFDLTLRPDFDFLMDRFRRYDDDGNVIELFSASDFRRVDGVLIPFEFKLQVSREGVSNYLVEETSLQSIKLNVELPAKLFDMPKDAHRLGTP